MHIRVTANEADITDGVCRHVTHCAFGLAFQRRFPEATRISVVSNRVYVEHDDVVTTFTPADVSAFDRWLTKFDDLTVSSAEARLKRIQPATFVFRQDEPG